MPVLNEKNQEKYKDALNVYDDDYKDKLAQILVSVPAIENDLSTKFSDSRFLFYAEDGIGIFNRVKFEKNI